MSITSSLYSFSDHNSNLNTFLRSVTPTTSHLPISLNDVINVQENNRSRNAHLRLQDIWEIYDEWSSCGVGIPILLNNGESIVQYYVPSLSAIQIFTKKSVSISSKEETDLLVLQYGSSSADDASTNSTGNNPRAEVTSNGFERNNYCLLGDEDHLYVQFYETCSPYSRVPFLDRVLELAQNFPGLLSFYIKDISPTSWMSVAWYPIYHIPARVYSTKDLCTCFLTFHNLSCSFQEKNKEDGDQEDDLVPFGLATYKMQGDVWNNQEKGDTEKIRELENAASSWLKQLHIQHHDFIFFTQ